MHMCAHRKASATHLEQYSGGRRAVRLHQRHTSAGRHSFHLPPHRSVLGVAPAEVQPLSRVEAVDAAAGWAQPALAQRRETSTGKSTFAEPFQGVANRNRINYGCQARHRGLHAAGASSSRARGCGEEACNGMGRRALQLHAEYSLSPVLCHSCKRTRAAMLCAHAHSPWSGHLERPTSWMR